MASITNNIEVKSSENLFFAYYIYQGFQLGVGQTDMAPAEWRERCYRDLMNSSVWWH